MSPIRGISWFAALGLAICAVAYAHAQQIGAADLLRGLADPSRWLIHSGDYASKRHSPLTQITPENVARLTPVWTFEAGLGSGRRDKFEATPIVIDGNLLRHRALQPRVGHRRPHRRADLALPAEAAPYTCVSAAAWSTVGLPCSAIVSSWRRSMRTSWRSIERPVRRSGTCQ